MAKRNETRVYYKAIADFSNLAKKAAEARKELKDLRDAEATGNSASLAADKARTASSKKTAKAVSEVTKETKTVAKETKNVSKASKEMGDASSTAAAKAKKGMSGVTAETKKTKKEVFDLTSALQEGAKTLANFGAGKSGVKKTQFQRQAEEAVKAYRALDAKSKDIVDGAADVQRAIAGAFDTNPLVKYSAESEKEIARTKKRAQAYDSLTAVARKAVDAIYGDGVERKNPFKDVEDQARDLTRVMSAQQLGKLKGLGLDDDIITTLFADLGDRADSTSESAASVDHAANIMKQAQATLASFGTGAGLGGGSTKQATQYQQSLIDAQAETDKLDEKTKGVVASALEVVRANKDAYDNGVVVKYSSDVQRLLDVEKERSAVYDGMSIRAQELVDKIQGSSKKTAFGQAGSDIVDLKELLSGDEFDTFEKMGYDVDRLSKVFAGFHSRATDSDRDMTKLNSTTSKLGNAIGGLKKKMDTLNNFRLHLMPPFVALIPILGAVLGLINPLIAGVGALGTAAFGLAANLASVAGAALAAIPALAALLTTAIALKSAFSGFGNAFSAMKAAKDEASTGGGGGGASTAGQLTQAEEIARAEENLRRAHENAKWAQEDLTKARQDYIDRLKDLKDALDDARQAEGLAENRARMSAEYAEEASADPNMSAADKKAAADYADYMSEQAKEATSARKDAQKEYDETAKTGVEGDRAVIMAKRAVTDATWAVRDAELALQKAQAGNGSSAAASAADKYRAALDKLSPSARATMLALEGLYDQWNELNDSIQEAFFVRVVDDIKGLGDVLPGIADMLADVADAAGGVAEKFLQWFTSLETQTDMGIINETTVQLVTDIGDGVLYIFEAFKDLAVVAGPLAETMGSGFKKGAENFANLVDTARKDGSLASWLETVYSRLSDWWTIVKNVGVTLFNYGSAASGFGDWITDGLKNLTQAWRDNSEEAKKAGSSFQEYLMGDGGGTSLQDALIAVKNLFASFFKWFARESKDSANLDTFTKIVDLLRTELGPAIARLFDALAEADISDSLVSALSEVIDIIAQFVESGAGVAFEAFFETFATLFGAMNTVLGALPDWALKLLVSALGGLAAMSFTRLFGLLTVMKGLAAGNLIGNVAKGMGTFVGLFKGNFLANVGKLVNTKWTNLTGAVTNLRNVSTEVGGLSGAASKGAGAMGKMGGAMRGVMGALGPIGIAVGVATTVWGIFNSYNEEAKKKQEELRTTLDETTGAITEQTSAMLARQIVDEGYLDDLEKLGLDSETYRLALEGNKEALDEVNAAIEEQVGWIEDLTPEQRKNIGNLSATEGAAARLQVKLDTTNKSLEEGKDKNQQYAAAAGTAAEATDRAADAAKRAKDATDGYKNAVKALKDQVQGSVDVVFNQRNAEDSYDAAKAAADAAYLEAEAEKKKTGEVSAETQAKLTDAQQTLSEATYDLADANFDAAAATGDMEGAVDSYNGSVQQGTQDTKDLSAKIAGLVGDGKDAQKTLKDLQTIIDAMDGSQITLEMILEDEDIQAELRKAKEALEEYWNTLTTSGPHSAKEKADYKAWQTAYANGGKVYRASGGDIPGYVPGAGNSDSVDAKLTPGEFVLRKAIVTKVGPENLARLNSGMMSLSDLMRAAMAKEAQGAPSTKAGNLSPLYMGKVQQSTPTSLGSFSRAQTEQMASTNNSTQNITNHYTVNNPVAQTAESSIIRAGQELAFINGWGG